MEELVTLSSAPTAGLRSNPRTRATILSELPLVGLTQGLQCFAPRNAAATTDNPFKATHNLTKLKERTPLRIQPEFPDYRYQAPSPKRQAELRVYQEIARSQIPGQVLYEVNTT